MLFIKYMQFNPSELVTLELAGLLVLKPFYL